MAFFHSWWANCSRKTESCCQQLFTGPSASSTNLLTKLYPTKIIISCFSILRQFFTNLKRKKFQNWFLEPFSQQKTKKEVNLFMGHLVDKMKNQDLANLPAHKKKTFCENVWLNWWITNLNIVTENPDFEGCFRRESFNSSRFPNKGTLK